MKSAARFTLPGGVVATLDIGGLYTELPTELQFVGMTENGFLLGAATIAGPIIYEPPFWREYLQIGKCSKDTLLDPHLYLLFEREFWVQLLIYLDAQRLVPIAQSLVEHPSFKTHSRIKTLIASRSHVPKRPRSRPIGIASNDKKRDIVDTANFIYRNPMHAIRLQRVALDAAIERAIEINVPLEAHTFDVANLRQMRYRLGIWDETMKAAIQHVAESFEPFTVFKAVLTTSI